MLCVYMTLCSDPDYVAGLCNWCFLAGDEASEIQCGVHHPVRILCCISLKIEHKTYKIWFVGRCGNMEVWVAVRQFSLNLFSGTFLMVVPVVLLHSVEILFVCLLVGFLFNSILDLPL